MERMPHDLRQYMDQRQEAGINPPFSISAAIDLMLQGAEAMRYMHSQKMVHRDLKPANILVKPVADPELRKEGFVVAKLADFGLAKTKNHITNYSHLTKNQGTRLWMAPEMFGVDAENDDHLSVAFPFKTDVYSFGLVCSEVLTGMTPFPNVKPSELYSLITDSYIPFRPELPESCPESLASLIRECWHTDPERRPPFTEICTMLRYLKALLILTGDGRLQQWMETPFRTGQYIEQNFDTSPPSSLFYTTFNGSSWTAAVALPHGIASPDRTLSLANHHGTLVAIHRSYKGSLYWNAYTDSSWTVPRIIVSGDAISRAAVATFKGFLFCLYLGAENKICCTSSAGPNLNDGWTRLSLNAGNGAHTYHTPALAGFGDRLFSVIRGLDDRIYWNYSFNGSAWSVYQEIENPLGLSKLRASPALVVYNNKLYCFVRKSLTAVGEGLFWSKLSRPDSTSWSVGSCTIKNFMYGFNSSPSFTVFNNQLVCTLQANGNELWYGNIKISGTSPEPMSIITTTVPTQYCQGEQGLCAIHSKLFCVYEPRST